MPPVRDPAAPPISPTGGLESTAVTNHPRRHRRTLSRRDSLVDELLDESLKILPLDNVAEEAKSQVPHAGFKVSLER